MKAVRLADVVSHVTLYRAWSKVYENQGCAGIDGQSLEDFAGELQAHLDTLRDEALFASYRPLPLLRVNMEKTGGGVRPLSIPAVRDRVLQTAAALVLEPLFEAEFEDCSFAYRKGRSVEQAVERIQSLQRQGYHWVVDADIESFFDSIEHARLISEVAKLVGDEGILGLLRLWLDATVVDGKRRFKLLKGVPQGSPIAPLLSNLYLDHLDESLLDNQHCLVRYADDFLVLCKSRERAGQALELTGELLQGLSLNLHAGKTRIVHFNQGFRFLGVEFIRSLAFKTEPDVSLVTGLSEPLQTTQPIPDSPPIADNTMQRAFAEAKIDAADFAALPDAMPVADAQELGIDEDFPAGHDPRLRTLYLLQHGQVLGKESERLTVRKGAELLCEIPAIKVDQVMVFGNAQITTQAMQFCLQERIPIYLLSGQGHYYGVIDSFTTEPVLLQREQFLRADDPTFCRRLAASMVRGKIVNSRVLLLRLARRHHAAVLRTAADALSGAAAQLAGAESLEQLRGYEGNAAKIYFNALAQTLDGAWRFTQRVRQPPTDPVNALLSYGYTLLFYNMYSLIRSRGLNPQVGFLHALRAGHPALASDMVEEFRAPVVDAVVWKLVLNRHLEPADFDFPAASGGACLLKQDARRKFIKALEDKLNAAIRHPASGASLDYRRCMEYQVQHLAGVIRGLEPAYHPMVLR